MTNQMQIEKRASATSNYTESCCCPVCFTNIPNGTHQESQTESFTLTALKYFAWRALAHTPSPGSLNYALEMKKQHGTIRTTRPLQSPNRGKIPMRFEREVSILKFELELFLLLLLLLLFLLLLLLLLGLLPLRNHFKQVDFNMKTK